MLGLLPQYWLDSSHCDALISLNSSSSTGGCQLRFDVPAVYATIPAHRIVLSSASEFFSALLSPPWHATSSQQLPAAVKLVLDADDIPAMIALLKCIYTGDTQLTSADFGCLALPNEAAYSCSAAVKESLSSQWQQLHLRIIKLADQYAVPGVMDVAVAKLTKLFSGQLSWPTIEAVLWMPPVLAQHQRVAALQQMAISGVKQRLAVLDVALAKPSGRQLLQALPADSLAVVLHNNSLAVTSENTVLAAIEIWLAGPVAQALAQLPANTCSSKLSCCFSSSSLMLNCTGSSGSSCCSRGCNSREQAAPEGGGVNEDVEAAGGAGRCLLSALALLMSSVRLSQCSGGFLAGALERMPWLCRVLRKQAKQLALMRQYYSSDSEGRYSLAMDLIQQNISPPWHPLLRKALPAGLSATISTSSDSERGQLGTCMQLSTLRNLLDTNASQRAAQALRLTLAQSNPAAPMPGALLAEFVMGGYCWRLSLVAAVFKKHRGSASSAAATGAAAQSAAGDGDDGTGAGQQRQQLALCIVCYPAWASNLAGLSGGTAAGSGIEARSQDDNVQGVDDLRCSSVDRMLAPAACASQVSREEAGHAGEPLSLKVDGDVPDAPAAAACDAGGLACPCSMTHSTEGVLGSAVATEGAGAGRQDDGSGPPGCDVCRALSSIAVDNAAAAAQRHTLTAPGGIGGSGGCSFMRSNLSAARDVLVGVSVLAAPSAAQLHVLFDARKARPPADTHVACRLAWDDAAGAAVGLVPLDATRIDGNSRDTNMVSSWVCDAQDLPAGAVLPAVAVVDAAGAAAGGGVAPGEGAGGAAAAAAAGGVADVPGVRRREGGAVLGEGGVLSVGWQAELWSRVAYSGELHWHSSLRLLND